MLHLRETELIMSLNVDTLKKTSKNGCLTCHWFRFLESVVLGNYLNDSLFVSKHHLSTVDRKCISALDMISLKDYYFGEL